MTMFEELYALARTATLSLVIAADEARGTLSVSVLPKPKKEFGEAALTQALMLTATPADLDAGFVKALTGYRQIWLALAEQAQATQQALQAAKEASAKKAAQARRGATKAALRSEAAPAADTSEDAPGGDGASSATEPAAPVGHAQQNLFA